jgi:hypothetical protein
MARTLSIEIDLDRLDRYTKPGVQRPEALREALAYVAANLMGEGVVWTETLANVGNFRIRDASSPCATIQVADPDNPFGPPAYEGPATDAHRYLAPGDYDAYDGEFDVCLRVYVDGRSGVVL